MDSATTDLQTRLSEHNIDLAEKFQWGLGAHHLFNSALVLGIIAVKKSLATVEDLEAYCEKQNADSWLNEFGIAEVKVIQLCITHARQRRVQGSGTSNSNPRTQGETEVQDQQEWQ